MTLKLQGPELRELKPRIMVCGIGGGGCNAVNNMITSGLSGVDFIVANTDAQALTASLAERIIQMGLQVTEGLGAGAQPEIGRAAAEEAIEEIRDHLVGAHMVFVTAGMGGGTGTGAAPVIARVARDMGILTVGVVTKPFQFEGQRRMRTADAGIAELTKSVDTLIVIPNQNLFRIATERTTFADAFAMADQVLYSGVASITDLMVKQGLVNLDFADVRSIMREMGKAMMGTGEAQGDKRALQAAEAAIANPLLDEVSMRGARGLLISITGGNDMTLYEVDEAASRIRQEVDEDANIILGATYDESLVGTIRVSVVATGIDQPADAKSLQDAEQRIADVAVRLRQQTRTEAVPVALAVAPAAPIPALPMAPAMPIAPTMPVETMPLPRSVERPAAAHGDVRIDAIAPRPSAYPEPVIESVAPRVAPQPSAATFVPPAPEMPMRPARLPQIDDLPPHIRDQIRAHQAGLAAPATTEQRRRTLLERLAAFGTSRVDDKAAAALPPSQPMAPPAPRPAAPPAHAEYTKRPVVAPQARPHSLDPHGRVAAPTPRSFEEDQLEIPAFLRRQSS